MSCSPRNKDSLCEHSSDPRPLPMCRTEVTEGEPGAPWASVLTTWSVSAWAHGTWKGPDRTGAGPSVAGTVTTASAPRPGACEVLLPDAGKTRQAPGVLTSVLRRVRSLSCECGSSQGTQALACVAADKWLPLSLNSRVHRRGHGVTRTDGRQCEGVGQVQDQAGDRAGAQRREWSRCACETAQWQR